jgi:hypothetical protein
VFGFELYADLPIVLMIVHCDGTPILSLHTRYQDWAMVQKNDERTIKKQRLLNESLVVQILEEQKKKIDKELA